MSAARTYTAVGFSGTNTRSRAFRWHHPAVPAMLFALVLVCSMAAFHPALCGISLAGALIFGLVCRGPVAVGKSLLWAVPLVVLVAFLNPFFSAFGTTQIGSMLGYPLYQESLAYGLCMGTLMCSVLVWMQNAAAVLTMEDIMALVGRVTPVVGLMMSMIARLVPHYISRAHHLSSVRAANSCVPSTVSSNAARGARQFGALLSWSMEDSLISADSMAARGWRADIRRTSYERMPFSRRDAYALVGVCIVGLLAGWGAWQTMQGFSFYPEITPIPIRAGMCAYALLMALPCFFEGMEALQWRR